MKKKRQHAIYIILVSLIFIGFGCNSKKTTKDLETKEVVEKVKKVQVRHEFSKPDIYVYRKFGYTGIHPVYLSKLNLTDSSKLLKANTILDSLIQKVILDFYFNECRGDSFETYFKVRDVYINTIHYWNRIKSIYIILLRQMPGNKVTSKVIFSNEVQSLNGLNLDYVGDFNLNALYEYENGVLKPSNLKKELNFYYPEIRLTPGKKNGSATAFKFIRLFHNGTANAIETSIIGLKNQKLDTLYFNREWIE